LPYKGLIYVESVEGQRTGEVIDALAIVS